MKRFISYNQLRQELFESQSDKFLLESAFGGKALKELVNAFADGAVAECLEVRESGADTLNPADLKDEMYEAMANVKTKEDFLQFIDTYKEKIEELQNDDSMSSTAKKIIKKIWDVVLFVGKWIAKGIAFTANHWQLILFLVGVIALCVHIHIGPIQALKMAWSACVLLYKGIVKLVGTPAAVEQGIETAIETETDLAVSHPGLFGMGLAMGPLI